MKNIKFFEEFGSADFSQEEIHENHEGHELNNYMFFQNLHTLKNAIEEMLELDPHEVDAILTNGHGWALDHIATSVDDVEEVYHFMANSIEMGYHGDEEQHGGAEDHEEEEHPIQIDIMGSDDNVDVKGEDEDEDDE
jgi:hypothetical protein